MNDWSNPGVWRKVFAATLIRLYPAISPCSAANLALALYPVSYFHEPVYAAELYALSEGKPAAPA